ncbi:claudin-like protein ZF-A89 isoform X2 [Syngnathus scovelli]|nr:claudin-like protein ZF-A89 isoform X2 [Syngnathus scovelli]XP_049581316.1 claudin-like protein ZF-A89 isoform X2 [Syngnathus scovelli]
MLGAVLCTLGWMGTIMVCALPQWKVRVSADPFIQTRQATWEGIWMGCVIQSTGQIHCKVFNSTLVPSSDLLTTRALIIASILLGTLASLLCLAGSKCTNCVRDQGTKIKICVASGVFFILAGVLCLIPVCWTANSVIRDLSHPVYFSGRAEKTKLGAALFIGWVSSALLIIGGALLGGAFLCANCPPKDYYPTKSPPSSAPNNFT